MYRTTIICQFSSEYLVMIYDLLAITSELQE